MSVEGFRPTPQDTEFARPHEDFSVAAEVGVGVEQTVFVANGEVPVVHIPKEKNFPFFDAF